MKQIFGSMINQKMLDFDEEVKSLGDTITEATISLYNAVVTKFLPTPDRIHYLFNLRDISKIYQGLLRSNATIIDSKSALLRLWIHESFRVFADRLINAKDGGAFIDLLSERLAQHFDLTFHNLCPSRSSPVFTEVLNKDGYYEDVRDYEKLRNGLYDYINEYNSAAGVIPLDLVLFKDAIEHSKLSCIYFQSRLIISVDGLFSYVL